MDQTPSDGVIRINVTLNTSTITKQFNDIITVMEAAISQADVTAYKCFDKEGAIMRWYEALDHYLSFTLSHSRVNIGIDYYVSEYFSNVAKYLNKPDIYQYIGSAFAHAVGIASQALYLAQQRIEQVGGKVEEVEFTPHGLVQGSYLLTGYYTPSDVTVDNPSLINRGQPQWGVNY